MKVEVQHTLAGESPPEGAGFPFLGGREGECVWGWGLQEWAQANPKQTHVVDAVLVDAVNRNAVHAK